MLLSAPASLAALETLARSPAFSAVRSRPARSAVRSASRRGADRRRGAAWRRTACSSSSTRRRQRRRRPQAGRLRRDARPARLATARLALLRHAHPRRLSRARSIRSPTATSTSSRAARGSSIGSSSPSWSTRRSRRCSRWRSASRSRARSSRTCRTSRWTPSTGLLVDYVERRKAQVIVRGLRAVSDFEYEFQMALMNRRLNGRIETVFMMPAEQYTYISSRLIKEVFSLGGRVHGLVPDMVEERLRRKSAVSTQNAEVHNDAPRRSHQPDLQFADDEGDRHGRSPAARGRRRDRLRRRRAGLRHAAAHRRRRRTRPSIRTSRSTRRSAASRS